MTGPGRAIVPHSGDAQRIPSPRDRAARAVRRRWARVRLVGAAAVVGLVPLALATFAFGHAFRVSETSRVDSRLSAATEVAVERVAAADSDAVARAHELASSRQVQLALARHDAAALARAGVHRRWLSITVVDAKTPSRPSRTNTITHTISITNGGTVIGRVVAVVSLRPLVATVADASNVDLALAGRGTPIAGPLRGVPLRIPPDRPAAVRARGTKYRVVRSQLGGGRDVVGVVSEHSIDAAVRKRQLSIGAAGILTAVALALFFVLIAPRTRLGGLGRGGARSPMAVLGEAVAAASDPRALLPVLLETVVAAVDGAGGHVVWDGERIAEIGSKPQGATPLVLPLDATGAVDERVIVLNPRRGSFSSYDREIARSLLSEGQIALENARLHNIVRRQAVTDELTDLANRRRFMEVLQQEVARSTRFGLELSLVLFDLDHFKQINDRYGHQTGDEVLRATAGVIRHRVRETDLPARIGGEEFAVILSGTSEAGAAAVAENLRTDLSRLVRVGDGGWRVTASFGVSEYAEGDSVESLIAAADRAMYRAKAAGRNRVSSTGAEPFSTH